MLHMHPAAAANNWTALLRGAVADIFNGSKAWRIWWLLAVGDIRQRYQRSLFGQFWLTISMGVTIGAIGLVYSALFQQDMTTYLPYLGIGLVCWSLIAGIFTDGCTVFTQSADFMRQSQLPRSLFANRMLLRNLIIFAHNLVIVVIIVVVFAIPVGWTTLLVIPGLVLMLLAGLWTGLFLGALCARFGDLPQIIASVVQIAFFVTPVIYRPDTANYRIWVATHLNPFASFLALLRDPLLGHIPEAWHYAMAILVTVGGFAITFPFFARYRARIVYWL
jgi:ABC-type polysaccharide/polyol phosphate export permease